MHTVLMEDRIHVAVDALILTEREGGLHVLLSRRGHEPCRGRWALPGRLLEKEESAGQAMEKLLAEMLPVERAYCEQLYTFTCTERDPRGRVISIAYLVIVPWEQLRPALERSDVTLECFRTAVQEGNVLLTSGDGELLPLDELAFDHGEIVTAGINRLRGKIEYTDIGFRFLNTPQAFSLGEMQRIFTAVLGKGHDASNFRRFVLSRYEASGQIRQTENTEKKGRGRPAALYCWMKQGGSAT